MAEDDPVSSGSDREIDEVVDAELRRHGATDDEIATARRRGALALLAATRAALPDEPRYASGELAEKIGIDIDLSKRLWRAMGFPDAPEGERLFTEADAEMLGVANASIVAGFTTVEESLQMTRILGSSMARIAQAMAPAGLLGETGRGPEDDARFALLAAPVLDTYARLLEYVWRRHLQAVLRRKWIATLDDVEAGSSYAVGFADLVGFTAMSQQVEPAELAARVSRFEDLAFDLIARHGGRVAKVIGDEVMFVVADPGASVATGIALAETYGRDEVLSDVRVGIAAGDVLVHDGDYYGPVVNLASRIVNIAVPGSVVVSAEVRDTVEADERFSFTPLRPRQLKDIGRVRLWRARRATPRP